MGEPPSPRSGALLSPVTAAVPRAVPGVIASSVSGVSPFSACGGVR